VTGEDLVVLALKDRLQSPALLLPDLILGESEALPAPFRTPPRVFAEVFYIVLQNVLYRFGWLTRNRRLPRETTPPKLREASSMNPNVSRFSIGRMPTIGYPRGPGGVLPTEGLFTLPPALFAISDELGNESP